ncbi:MAG: hypothetical protein Q4C98_00025 [Capnocytophaga sp.]|nr:hypothetical protein [Capnocytophaga sp.]
MESKIISAFMFSEPHEQDLLWLKFNIENNFVTEWIITESHYTFQGKRKPIYLKEILNQERFAPFRDKVHYIEINRNYHIEFEPDFLEVIKRKIKRCLNKHFDKNYEFVTYSELASFHAEINQRQACVDYITKKYNKNDIVLLCDADEMFDFNNGKINDFNKIVKQNTTPFYLKREIFCYDFDNYTNRKRYNPIVKVLDLTKNKTIQILKHPTDKNSRKIIQIGNEKFIFEYTFCFSKEAITKKLNSFAHVTDLNQNDLDFCFANNISMISPDKIDDNHLKNKEFFYSKLTLDETNSPKFVRDNFEKIRTGVVNENYLITRKENNLNVI